VEPEFRKDGRGIFWYAKSPSLRRAGLLVFVLPGLTMVGWGLYGMAGSNDFFLLHAIGWICLFTHLRLCQPSEGCRRGDKSVLLWRGYSIGLLRFHWRSDTLELPKAGFKLKASARKDQRAGEASHCIQAHGRDSRGKVRTWPFQQPFGSRDAARAFLARLKEPMKL
jgi:hypothetical protein